MAARITQRDTRVLGNHADGASEHVLVNVLTQPQNALKPALTIDVNACIHETYLAMTENNWDR